MRLLQRQTKASLEVALLEKHPCSKFIIAVGSNATAFLSSFVMNSGVWKEVGCAKLWNEWCRTTDTVHLSPTDAFCVFYQLKSDPSVFLCQCSCYIAEDQQFQWLEKVRGRKPWLVSWVWAQGLGCLLDFCSQILDEKKFVCFPKKTM